ncbi:MAG: flavodoxin family protein [Tissierellia bacterium]|nr:flavodoxin family protein [Tissierellia bacterium]
MTILITYSSLTGNTEKVARAISEVLPQAELAPLSQVEDFSAYEGIILGFWAWRGRINPEAQAALEKIQDKPLGLFFTYGARPDSSHVAGIQAYARDLVLSQGQDLLATFSCQGKINPASTKRRLALPKEDPHYLTQERLENHLASRTHPDARDLAGAQAAFRDFQEALDRVREGKNKGDSYF